MGILRFFIINSFLIILTFANSNLDLTNDEKEYLKNHPIIKVQNESDWKPYNYNKNGIALGHSIDYMNLLASKIGVKIEYVSGYTWKEYLEMLKSDSLDVMINIAKTPEREKYMLYTSQYSNILSSLYMLDNGLEFKRLKDLKGKTISVVAGMIGESVLKKNYPEVNIYPAKNSLDALKAVIYGKADGVIQANVVGAKLIDKYNLITLKPIFELKDPSFNMHLHMSTNKSDKILRDILEKGKSLISEVELDRLHRKWFKPNVSQLKLTDEEKDYLYIKKKINYCIDPDWYPFQKNEKGKHIGMSADVLKVFEKTLNVSFNLVKTKDWSESLQFVKEKKCDLLPFAMKTKDRTKYLNFTENFIESPIVISTLIEEPFVENIKFLKDKKIAITKDYVFIDIIKNRFQNIQIVEVNSINEGLSLVKEKVVYGYIGSLPSITYKINKKYIDVLKISSILEEHMKLATAINKEDLILLSIFDKLIKAIDKNEISSIVNKWTSIKFEKHFDYVLIYKIIAVFLAVILFMLLWGAKLKKDKERIDNLYKKLDLEKNRTDLLNMQLIQKELKLEEVNRKLKVLSSTDKLTKIFNRRTIDEYLEKIVKRNDRKEDIFSIIMIDIDFFKKVNDSFGHQVGDEVLKEVTNLVEKTIRKSDIFGRWGGEEFLIICPSTKIDGVKVLAENIRIKIEKHTFKTVGKKTISLGATTYEKGDTLRTILKRCDEALYEAKRNGRNQVMSI